ncbi:MAG: hypothetical protein DHS20C13_03220 [Thermodesulfobacteriota bacterium]|nr:MAG: hypothetical protein DHS20C13_03220 [Thermodesulfobacteriota bacterium]
MTDAIHPNIALLQKFDIRNLDACADIVADNFVWHFFNPKLPVLQGDYNGLEELKGFFAKLDEMTNHSFNVTPVEARAVGDELVVVQTCNRIAIGGSTIEFDVVVVWRFVDGKIAEAWDIPSVFQVRNVE